jgi:hypothetical protein
VAIKAQEVTITALQDENKNLKIEVDKLNKELAQRFSSSKFLKLILSKYFYLFFIVFIVFYRFYLRIRIFFILCFYVVFLIVYSFFIIFLSF